MEPLPHDGSGLLITGGSGRLGSELRALLPQAAAPRRQQLDVSDPVSVMAALEQHRPTTVLHTAAYTDVSGAEREPERCWQVNVLGTRAVADACAALDLGLVHISTDYVFWGEADPARAARGGYREDDPVGPVRNRYALSKLAAEDEARRAPRHLIIRTSFRPRQWPYPTAFTDLRSSQAYVDEIAPEIALVALNAQALVEQGVHVLHVAGPPTTAFELARRRAPDVLPASKHEIDLGLPDDVVLDQHLWQRLRQRLRPAQPSPLTSSE